MKTGNIITIFGDKILENFTNMTLIRQCLYSYYKDFFYSY